MLGMPRRRPQKRFHREGGAHTLAFHSMAWNARTEAALGHGVSLWEPLPWLICTLKGKDT